VLPTGQLPTAPAAELPTSQCGTQQRQNDLQLQQAFVTFGKTTRLGKPDDLAAIITFLLSEEAEWITGQVWYIGGGSHLRQ
jgi:NAD(P)-dependent dehydrogenase (short-subunit alcohol dehydrogenase family)